MRKTSGVAAMAALCCPIVSAVAQNIDKSFVSVANQATSTSLRSEQQESTLSSVASVRRAPVAMRIDAAKTFADSTVLYGLHKIVYDNAYPAGEMMFHYADEVAFNKSDDKLADAANAASTAFYVDGKYYMVLPVVVGTQTDEWGFEEDIEETHVRVYDASTGSLIAEHTLGSYRPMQVSTYDASTGKAYIAHWTADYDKALVELDLSTMTANELSLNTSESGVNVDNIYWASLVATQDGYLYGYSSTNSFNLMQVNIATGEVKIIGQSGVSLYGASPSAMVYDRIHQQIILAATTSDWNTHIYSVSPLTGVATKVADCPNKETFLCLYFNDAVDKAPAAPTSIAYSNGKLSFVAPTMSHDGKTSLSGTLSAHVTIDDVGQTFDVLVGEEVGKNILLANGLHTIKVQVANENGASQERIFLTFVGVDVPAAVGNAKFSISEEGKNLVTWDAPTESSNGGPFDENTLTYNVYRMPGNVLVSEGQTETSFVEDAAETRLAYYYRIVPVGEAGEGDEAFTNKVFVGQVFEPDYVEDFADESNFALYKTIDANEDGLGWSRVSGYFGSYVSCLLNGSADDYMTTAGFRLKKGVIYSLTFVGSVDSEGWPVEIDVFMTKSADIDSERLEVGQHKVSKSSDNDYSALFSVGEDGVYYVNFRCHTDNGSGFTMQSYSLVVEAVEVAPDAVSDLVAKAAADGSNSATLTFTTPSVSCEGTAIAELSKVEILQDGKVVKTLTSVATGETVELTLETTEGLHTYSVRAYSAAGKGKSAKTSVYVGHDLPSAVAGLKAKMNADKQAVLSWEPISEGAQGGYVDTESITYKVVRFYQPTYEEDVIAEGLTSTSFVDDSYVLHNRQDRVQYKVIAVDDKGEGAETKTTIVLGEAYAMPYAESFASREVANAPWSISADFEVQVEPWFICGNDGTILPFDKDGGVLTFSYYTQSGDQEKTEATVSSPRISLAESNNPSLSFYMYHGAEVDEDELTLSVMISADDAEPVEIGRLDYNDGVTDGWRKHTFDLSAFKSALDIQIYLCGVALNSSATIYLDDFHVRESYSTNLAIASYDMPKRVNVGDKTQFSVSVLNDARELAKEFSVLLLRDGEVVETQTGSNLPVGEEAEFVFDYEGFIADAGNTHTHQIKVVIVGDENMTDNATPIVDTYVNGSKTPRVDDLSYEQSSDGNITLSWSMPKTEVVDAVTDDFEAYDDFIIDGIGDWKVYDADQAIPLYFGGETMPHTYEKQAWYVWNPSDAGFGSFAVLNPHSGKKYLTAFSASDAESKSTANDNWLISPLVKGGTDVSFFVKEALLKYGPETFEFLYSEAEELNDSITADDIKTFVKLDTETVDFVDWKEMAYTLPESARYFAIRHTTQSNGEVLMLDDITYMPLYGGTSTLSLKSYNVYRDGVLLAKNVKTPTYKLSDNGAHTYQVSVSWVLADGETIQESMLSNVVVVGNQNALSEHAAENIKIIVRGSTICIEGSTDDVVVYSTDGKVVRFQSGANSLTVAPGVYLVKVGTQSYKILVK